MALAEWALQSLAHPPPWVQPLVYPRAACHHGREHYYVQADLPAPLQADVDFTAPVFGLISGALAREGGGAPRFRRSQAPRLWLSTAGSVSPMHYDRSSSFLAQVCGHKRLVFVPPEQLHLLRPFPDTHMLARRARVPVPLPAHVGDGGGRGAVVESSAQLRGREVLLEPGDVVFFGPLWPHYTVSEGASASVTCRFTREEARDGGSAE